MRRHSEVNNPKKLIEPVIRIVLVIFITVTLSFLFHERVFPYHDCPPTPKAELDISGNQSVNWTVTITEIDRKLAINDTEYYLRDKNGVAVPGEQGNVENIIGLDQNNDTVNITFSDNDEDGRFTAGDSFWLRGSEQGGPAEAGFSFRMAYGITGDTIAEPVLE